MAYTKPQQRKKEESKRLRGEREKIKFSDVRIEIGQDIGSGKGRRQKIP